MAFDANDTQSIPENDGSINISQTIGDGVKGRILAVMDPIKTKGENDAGQPYEDHNLVLMIDVLAVAGSPSIRKPLPGGNSETRAVKVGDKGLLWFRYAREMNGGELTKALAPFTSALSKTLREKGLTTARPDDIVTLVHNRLGEKDPKYPKRQPAKLADCKYELATGGFAAEGEPVPNLTADDL